MGRAEAIQNAVKKHAVKHIGFKGAENKVESEGYSKSVAGAIISSASRKASAAAKSNNPRLKRVK